jgi:hypothetical protein
LILNTEKIRVKEAALSALTMLIRGENLEAKRQFLVCEGI